MKTHTCHPSTLIFLFTVLLFSGVYAQSPLLMNAAGGPVGNGPKTNSQTVTLWDEADGMLSYAPEISLTYSLSNQQFGPGKVQGWPAGSGLTFGTSQSTFGETPTPVKLYPTMGSISLPDNSFYTAYQGAVTGADLDVNTDRAVWMMSVADALINNGGEPLAPIGGRIYYGDLTISFSRPVINPVLQITGLGGFSSNSHNGTNYILGFTTDFVLASPYTMTRLSGNPYFNVSDTLLNNSARYLGANSMGLLQNGVMRYAASGSVLINCNNIRSVTFRLYFRGDGGFVQGGAATDGLTPVWSEAINPVLPWKLFDTKGILAGDAYTIGYSMLKPVPVNVSGNVFNDPNGGNVNNSTGLPNLVPSTMFASLVNFDGNVAATSVVAQNGTYAFTNLYNDDYTVVLSDLPGVSGGLPPVVNFPVNWVNTGDFNGAPNTGNTNVTPGISSVFPVLAENVDNINFGINQLPESAVSFDFLGVNPGGTVNSTVKPLLFQNSWNSSQDSNSRDYSNGIVTAIRITAFPTKATSITIKGVTYTNSTWPAGGVTVPFTAGIGTTKPITVDPVDGVLNMVIPFVSIDNAGFEDPTPGRVTLSYFSVLPVKMISFTAQQDNDNGVQLNWLAADQQDVTGYIIEHSNNGKDFSAIGSVDNIASVQYTFTAAANINGSDFYRLKIIYKQVSFAYSTIIKINCSGVDISTQPNPFTDHIVLNIHSKIQEPAQISLLDVSGKLLKNYTLLLTKGFNQVVLQSVSELVKGVYILKIKTTSGVCRAEKLNK